MASTSEGMAGLQEKLLQLQKMLNISQERQIQLAFNDDQFFLIVIAIIIFFMQCGFAFLEAGSVR